MANLDAAPRPLRSENEGLALESSPTHAGIDHWQRHPDQRGLRGPAGAGSTGEWGVDQAGESAGMICSPKARTSASGGAKVRQGIR